MKRMLITAAAVIASAGAFAAPASAQNLGDVADFEIASIRAVCQPGETYADCAERILRGLDPYTIVFDVAIPLAFDTVGDGITAVENAVATARAVCEQISSSCDSALF